MNYFIFLIAIICAVSNGCGEEGDPCHPLELQCCSGLYCGKNGEKEYHCNLLRDREDLGVEYEILEELEEVLEKTEVGCGHEGDPCHPLDR